MRPFKYTKVQDAGAAVQINAANTNSKFLAGGTNILDLMKEDVERPDELVDITRLNLAQIKTIADGANKGGVSIGGLGKNTDAANHPLVRQNFPLLTQDLSGVLTNARPVRRVGATLSSAASP